MHPTKRKRLNNATSTLAKPFRSPMQVRSNRDDKTLLEDQSSQDGLMTQAVKNLTSPNHTVHSIDPPLIPAPLSKTFSSPTRPTGLSSPSRSSHMKDSLSDEVYVSLQKQHSALSLCLKDLSHSIDATSQALTYTTSSTDTDLERVIIKWRTVARDLAEELFAVAVDRVNKMGGVVAWRERYEKQDEVAKTGASWGFDESCCVDEDDISEEQKEQFELVKDEASREAQKFGLNHDHVQNIEGSDDTFTMGMLLRQLNIDPELIGYDGSAQCWSD